MIEYVDVKLDREDIMNMLKSTQPGYNNWAEYNTVGSLEGGGFNSPEWVWKTDVLNDMELGELLKIYLRLK